MGDKTHVVTRDTTRDSTRDERRDTMRDGTRAALRQSQSQSQSQSQNPFLSLTAGHWAPHYPALTTDRARELAAMQRDPRFESRTQQAAPTHPARRITHDGPRPRLPRAKEAGDAI